VQDATDGTRERKFMGCLLKPPDGLARRSSKKWFSEMVRRIQGEATEYVQGGNN